MPKIRKAPGEPSHLQADKKALAYADRMLKDWLLWANRPAIQELKDRLRGAFIMGYLSGHEDGIATQKSLESTDD